MLILTRRVGETLMIGDDVTVTVLGVKGNQSWCEIDLERCVGCEVCVHIPQKKSNPYELLVCPWDAIEMVPTEQVAQVVAQIGGPPEYIYENWDRLVGTAQHLAELKANA